MLETCWYPVIAACHAELCILLQSPCCHLPGMRTAHLVACRSSSQNRSSGRLSFLLWPWRSMAWGLVAQVKSTMPSTVSAWYFRGELPTAYSAGRKGQRNDGGHLPGQRAKSFFMPKGLRGGATAVMHLGDIPGGIWPLAFNGWK